MNLLRLIIALLFLGFGLVIGFLNDSPGIVLDLLFYSWETTPGNAIILSLLLGVLIGGLIVFAAAVLPLYARLHKAGKSVPGSPSAPGHPEA